MTADLYFAPPDLTAQDMLAGNADADGPEPLTVPGATKAWLSATEAHDQPEVEACAVVGKVIACAYTTASAGRSMAQLQPMSIQLIGMLVNAL